MLLANQGANKDYHNPNEIGVYEWTILALLYEDLRIKKVSFLEGH